MLPFAAVLLAWGCSSQRAEVFPDAAAPGEVVQVRVPSDRFKDPQKLRARIAGKGAPVVRVVDARVVEVLVPFAPTGAATLAIVDGNRVLGEGPLTVLPPPSRRVVVTIRGKEIKLLRVTPAADPPTGSYRRNDVRRISYDLFNSQGGLVLTGSVLHPSDGGELLHDPAEGRLRRTKALDPTTIDFVIPRIEGPQTLVVYDTPPGADLADPAGRDRRSRLASFPLPQEKTQ